LRRLLLLHTIAKACVWRSDERLHNSERRKKNLIVVRGKSHDNTCHTRATLILARIWRFCYRIPPRLCARQQPQTIEDRNDVSGLSAVERLATLQLPQKTQDCCLDIAALKGQRASQTVGAHFSSGRDNEWIEHVFIIAAQQHAAVDQSCKPLDHDLLGQRAALCPRERLCCSVLQCVAECCSVLQCVAVRSLGHAQLSAGWHPCQTRPTCIFDHVYN